MELVNNSNLKIYSTNDLSNEDINQSNCLVVLINTLLDLSFLSDSQFILGQIKAHKALEGPYGIWQGWLPNKIGTKVLILKIPNQFQAYDYTHKLMSTLKKLVLHSSNYIIIDKINSHTYTTLTIRTLLSHLAIMPTFKSKNVGSGVTQNIHCYTNLELNTVDITSSHDGNYIARYLTTLPTNYLTPSIYKDKLESLSASEGWEFKVYDQKELLTIGAEAFSAVSRASQGACIIKMTYKPSNIKTSKKICLIGKGVCFDTGGVNVKSPEHMYGMQEDMGGSATAIGSILMLSRMDFEYQVECWVAITSNLISENSYLPNEVITAINGTTIEIVDTDAEGRLILADTLAMASMDKPELIIDYATLTGASLRAVGTRYSTIFSNYSDWYSTLIKAGEISGERVWPMPMDDDYLNDIKSDIADIKQCSNTPGPDHIHAAKFLEKFVSHNVRWLHIDLSASCNKGGLGAVPSDFTGFGVWFTQELIRQLYTSSDINK